MKKNTKMFMAFVMLVISNCAFAQYQSTYMTDPDLAKNVVLNEADFWSNFKDQTYGGYFNEVNSNGTANTSAPKSFCSQSRLAYAFTRAFMLTGDMQYLEDARYAMNFVYDYAWDPINDGWYYASDRNGSNPKNNLYHDNKWSFIQHYAMVGNAAINEATDGTITWNDGHESDKLWLSRGLNSVYDHLWDNTPGVEGFFNYAGNDWSNPYGKGFTPTADAMTTHATVMALRGSGTKYYDAFFHLADKIATKIVRPAFVDGQTVILEELNSDWSAGGYAGEEYYGHDLKCVWNLCRAYLIDPSKTYLKDKALALLDEIISRNYVDLTYGGVYYRGGNTNKSHWTQEQAILSSILASSITDDVAKKQTYLALADNCWKFVEDEILDMNNGGSYAEVNRDGSQKYAKGDYWEAGYHTGEMSYYTYLYGNIYLNNEPVDLYYHFEGQTVAQVQKLTPLSIEDDKLMIVSVTLDGQPFSNFNAETRELNIAANQGGTFKVQFKYNDGNNCPTVNFGADQSLCDASSIILNSGLGTDAGYAFTWSKDGVVIINSNTASSLSVDVAGVYQLTATNGTCTVSDEIVVTDQIPTIELGTDFTYSSPVTLSTGLTSAAHIWYKDGVAISGATASSLQITGAGTYSVQVANGYCPSSTDEIVVSEQDLQPIADAGADFSIVLPVTSFTLAGTATSGNGTLSYAWSTSSSASIANANTLSPVVSGITNAGVYQFTLTVTDEDGDIASDVVSVTVFDALVSVTGVTINSTVGALLVGETVQLSATVAPADANNTTVSWSSSDVAVLSVDANGFVSALSAGSATITVTTEDGSFTDVVSIDVNTVPVASVAIEQSDFTLLIGASNQLTATVLPANAANQSVVWSSNDESIVSVDAYGTVTAISAGSAIVTVSTVDGDFTDAVTITVNPILVSGVSIDQSDIALLLGETSQLSATVLPANATNLAVVWSSSNATIASVDVSGTVNALAVGTASISVTSADGGYSDVITVTVSEDSGSGDCYSYDVPSASDWIGVNNWNESSDASCTFTNTAEAVVYNHRAWGNNYAYLIQKGQPMSITAGEAYTISLDILDEDARLSGMKVGICTGWQWDKPTGVLAAETSVDAGFSSASYINKSATITATGSSEAAFVFVYVGMNTQMITQNFYLKNLNICNSSSSLKSAYADYGDDIATDYAVSVYPTIVKDYITVEVEGADSVLPVSVQSVATGIAVYNGTLRGNVLTIDAREFVSGTYIVACGDEHVFVVVE